MGAVGPPQASIAETGRCIAGESLLDVQWLWACVFTTGIGVISMVGTD